MRPRRGRRVHTPVTEIGSAPVCHHPELAPLVADPLDATRVGRIAALLGEWQTLHIERLPTGLVSAVHGAGANEVSGYDAVWLRDTVHVAHVFHRTGDSDAAVEILEALLQFQQKTVARFDDVIAGRVDAADPHERPHVRFDGRTLEEIAVPWAHAQNDALGYVFWLAAVLMRDGVWIPDADQHAVLARYPAYFEAIDYPNDRDSGHWEEERRRTASSVGTVVAALETMATALERVDGELRGPHGFSGPLSLRSLAFRGRAVLDVLLPQESPPERGADAATLFLLEPLGVVGGPVAAAILDRVDRELVGPYGIRRYRGDSYWCADYRELLSPETRSTDYSTSTAERDALLKPGTEAQWCIFDPVLAVYHARRYRRTRHGAHRARADHHLRRAIGQITGPGEWCAPGLCTEAWFLASSDEGVYRPNDQTPLAWTQANLRWALEEAGSMLG